MGLYERYILPKAMDLACGIKPMMRQRRKIVPLARGHVLEVGVGSGLNFPFYDSSEVERVWALDPSPEMIEMARKRAAGFPFEVKFIEGGCETVPLEDGSVDTVLVTYTFCSIPDAGKALQELRRILKPGGELLFCEHGIAPEREVRFWQELVTPLWKKVAGGCHFNRDIPRMVEAAGFHIKDLEAGYIRGWRPASYNYLGRAEPVSWRQP